MNKLEVGMWVRNCYGRIAKIQYIEDNIAYCDNWLYKDYEDHIDFIQFDKEEDMNEITNSSFNIIDLIEVGDYVNGEQVRYIEEDTDYRVLAIDEDYTYIIAGYDCDGFTRPIKSIVTHEQFESMEYKV